MPGINRKLLMIAAAAAVLGCGDNRPAAMSQAEVQKTIADENARTEERIRELEKKYGKDHPIVKEERGNIGPEK